jgi:trafficking protein particle complex subunit 8
VRFFLGLLHGSDHVPVSITSPKANGEVNGDLKSLGTDKVFLEDFRVAFAVSIYLYFLAYEVDFCLF